jgi:quercetin dioxygenase-like cupin family protein
VIEVDPASAADRLFEIRHLPAVRSLAELPEDGGRYVGDSAGELVRILNGPAARYIAHIEFKSGGRPRGNHVHRHKTEMLYILSGQLHAIYVDERSGQRFEVELSAGDFVQVKPGCAHAYQAHVDSAALEMTGVVYDPADTYKFLIDAGLSS